MKHVASSRTAPKGRRCAFWRSARKGSAGWGAHEHPDVTLDYIAFGYSMPAWDAGDYGADPGHAGGQR